MTKAILSFKYPEFSRKLCELGYEIIPSEIVDCFIPYERDHADMQCLMIDDTAFVLKHCTELAEKLAVYFDVITCGENIGTEYPSNVALNVAVVGKRLIGRIKSVDVKITSYCKKQGFEIINVNQGYANCSCAVVSDNAIITADKGIYNTLKDAHIDVLLIGQGNIALEGAEYGFIGGASGYDPINKILYFCGNIDAHPDSKSMKSFCDKYTVKIVGLSSGQLTDIGGIIFC